jgi:hypothetical protein
MKDDTPNIIASAAITLPLATLALIARLIARRITKAGYGVDDTFAVVGWVCYTLWCGYDVF